MKSVFVIICLTFVGLLHAKTAIEFQHLEGSVIAPNDRLEIISVSLVDTTELKLGSTVEVIGRYQLGSVDRAQLGLSITSSEKGGTHDPESQEQQVIAKGSGDFRLLRKVDRHGGIHLSIYPQLPSGRFGQSTSRLYFLALDD